MADAPLGQAPPTGGRVREHATDAERARAWRDRRRQAQLSEAPSEQRASEPALAITGLALAVEQLRVLTREHQAAVAGQMDRLADALDVLADPAAVERALDTARVAADRRVAEAHAELLAVQAAAAHANEEGERARTEAVEATAAAEAAWLQVETLEAALADRDTRIAALHEQVEQGQQRTAAELGAARRDADVARQKQQTVHAAELQDARSEVAQAARERDRVAATLDRVEHELRHTREQLPAAVTAARAEATEQAAARYAAELEALRARTDGQIAGLTARLEAASELAATHRGEAARLARQLDQQRADAATPAPVLRIGGPGARRSTAQRARSRPARGKDDAERTS